MIAKPSLPYKAAAPHNLMHDKVLVSDDTVITGSFNFSLNATRHAENALAIQDKTLADMYVQYVDGLVARYG